MELLKNLFDRMRGQRAQKEQTAREEYARLLHLSARRELADAELARLSELVIVLGIDESQFADDRCSVERQIRGEPARAKLAHLRKVHAEARAAFDKHAATALPVIEKHRQLGLVLDAAHQAEIEQRQLVESLDRRRQERPELFPEETG